MNRMRAGWLGLVLALALTGCADEPAAAPAGDPETTAPGGGLAPDEIEEFARIQLPESAGDLRSTSASANDTSVYLSFSMDAAELDAFLADARLSAAPQPGVRALQVGAGRELGWDTDAVTEFVGHREDVDGLIRELLVDLTAADRPVVYLHAYTA